MFFLAVQGTRPAGGCLLLCWPGGAPHHGQEVGSMQHAAGRQWCNFQSRVLVWGSQCKNRDEFFGVLLAPASRVGAWESCRCVPRRSLRGRRRRRRPLLGWSAGGPPRGGGAGGGGADGGEVYTPWAEMSALSFGHRPKRRGPALHLCTANPTETVDFLSFNSFNSGLGLGLAFFIKRHGVWGS